VTSILLVKCPDRSGIVAALSTFLRDQGGNILDADQHTDADTGTFFMRVTFDRSGFRLDTTDTYAALQELGSKFSMSFELHDAEVKPRVAVFAGKTPHCLYDLLLNQNLGEFPGEIAAVISNHAAIAEVARHFDVPFHHVPMEGLGKAEAERLQRELLLREKIDLLVLARYMQVLSPGFCRDYAGRAINIHHSFLPAFAGAKPYHQAKERGVKIIGATAHYVTPVLDDGPIIAQDTSRVTHRDTAEDMARKGRDLERRVLTQAVRLHLERRVLITGNRTIVFGE
jgi:formyltetrahydrofolate deformylase